MISQHNYIRLISTVDTTSKEPGLSIILTTVINPHL